MTFRLERYMTPKPSTWADVTNLFPQALVPEDLPWYSGDELGVRMCPIATMRRRRQPSHLFVVEFESLEGYEGPQRFLCATQGQDYIRYVALIV